MYSLVDNDGGQLLDGTGGARGTGGAPIDAPVDRAGTGGTVVGTGGAPLGTGGSGAGGIAMGTGGAGGKGTGGVDAGTGTGGGPDGTGGAPAGTGGMGTGGAGTGGAPDGTGGAGTGGMGTGGAGTGGATGLDCTAALVPSTGGVVTSFADWDAAAGRWGPTGGLHGSKFAYGGGPSGVTIPAETATVDTTAQNLRLQLGVVSSGYAGGGISFDSCVSAAAYTSLRFTISGSVDGCPYQVQLQTFEQRPATFVPPGGCASNCSRYPAATGLTGPAGGTVTITVPFSMFAGWTTTMATELVGVQWQVNSPATPRACTVDIRIDDVTFIP